jgi:hypothetical protein
MFVHTRKNAPMCARIVTRPFRDLTTSHSEYHNPAEKKFALTLCQGIVALMNLNKMVNQSK